MRHPRGGREALRKSASGPAPFKSATPRTPADCDGTDRALQWWAEARSIAGTLAEDYLVQHRGIRTFPPDVDEVLRFHPRCIFGPGQFHPCLLALVRDVATDRPQAIIRTALATTGEKIGRMALGPTANGAIKLWADDCVTIGLVVGEGIETCLAAASMEYRGTLLQPVWSLIDAGHIGDFAVLAGIEALTILVDHDKPDQHGRHAGQHAAQQCAKRWLAAAGREVEVLMPSAIGADFNNVALARTQ
jgi:putative DNA primase/helicase